MCSIISSSIGGVVGDGDAVVFVLIAVVQMLVAVCVVMCMAFWWGRDGWGSP